MLKLLILTLSISVVLGSRASISLDEVFGEGADWEVKLIPRKNYVNCDWFLPQTHESKLNKTCDRCNCTVRLLPQKSFYGILTFTFTHDGIRNVTFDFHVKSQGESALYQLSTSAIPELISAKYQFLWLSHFHHRYQAYNPNVGKFFYERFEKNAEMIFTITEYIKMKQASIGERKPNFHKYMVNTMENFAATMFSEYHKPSNMIESFEVGIKLDSLLLQTFTGIADQAEDNGDAELHEFISNDVIPLYTSALKTSNNHLMTLRGMDSSDPELTRLSQFIFDKNI